MDTDSQSNNLEEDMALACASMNKEIGGHPGRARLRPQPSREEPEALDEHDLEAAMPAYVFCLSI